MLNFPLIDPRLWFCIWGLGEFSCYEVYLFHVFLLSFISRLKFSWVANSSAMGVMVNICHREPVVRADNGGHEIRRLSVWERERMEIILLITQFATPVWTCHQMGPSSEGKYLWPINHPNTTVIRLHYHYKGRRAFPGVRRDSSSLVLLRGQLPWRQPPHRFAACSKTTRCRN